MCWTVFVYTQRQGGGGVLQKKAGPLLINEHLLAMICGIASQNVRCIAGAFGTIITQVFYTCTYVQIKRKYTLSPLCEHKL